MTQTTPILPPLCHAFACFIAGQSTLSRDAVLPRTAAWLSLLSQQGHVCLDLAEKSEQPWYDDTESETYCPPLAAWRETLQASPCVSHHAGYAPMVLVGNRLYLHRFYTDESRVADAILSRLCITPTSNASKLLESLERVFSGEKSGDQRQAVALASSQLFTVISGGPGTGKTTSLVKLLAVLLEQQPNMQIKLAAPTGKAAARMMEAIRGMRERVDVPCSVRQLIPTQASTIHRLLGFDGRCYRYGTDNLLSLDCLVIDEASMVDLPLMARIVNAMPPQARLILLGDRNQLASVEAGSVLGDITGHGLPVRYSEKTRLRLNTLGCKLATNPAHHSPPIADAIALLSTSHRFSSDSGIASLASATNDGNTDAVTACFSGGYTDILWQHDAASINAQAVTHYARCYVATADETLRRCESFRVLCAIKKGPTGIEGINQGIAALLRQRGLLQGLHGTLIMITANHYGLDLFNGDIGLLWRDSDGETQAYFRQLDEDLRIVPLVSLPAYAPAWAMTVHKAQGSEFEQVMMVLPDDQENPLLSRELLYTAISRARQQFILYARPEVLQSTVKRKLHRSSGLAIRLGWKNKE